VTPDEAKFCQYCGAQTADTASALPESRYILPKGSNVTLRTRSKRKSFLYDTPFGYPVLIVLVAVVGVAIVINSVSATHSKNQQAEERKQRVEEEQKRREADAAFNSMTSAQHIEQARLALKPNSTLSGINEGIRNLEAISASAPEAAEAKALQRKLAVAKERLERARAAAEASTERAERTLFAKTMENNLLHQGLSVDVLAIGKDNTTLHIKWVLVSKALAYQLSEKGEILESARKIGFRRVEITDGYNETWYWNLK
jgi:flagellar biosynthesis GTPase FlhF